MDVDRRSLMKGMLAGGALLAFGVPPWRFAAASVQAPKHWVLLLGGTGGDGMFARGAQAAYAGMAYNGLKTVTLKNNLLTDTAQIVDLLDQSKGTRWIAVMDDAGAMIFLELARATGARLVSMGMHACSNDATCHLRHDFATTSRDHSAAGLLASHFLQQPDGFSITERFLQEPAGAERGVTTWGAPGFFSHRFPGSGATHVHYSGCSFAEGSRLLGLDTTEEWIPIPPQVCTRESVTWRSRNWMESVGYAVAASALGIESVQESCMTRAFVRRTNDRNRTQPAERFVSLVMAV